MLYALFTRCPPSIICVTYSPPTIYTFIHPLPINSSSISNWSSINLQFICSSPLSRLPYIDTSSLFHPSIMVEQPTTLFPVPAWPLCIHSSYIILPLRATCVPQLAIQPHSNSSSPAHFHVVIYDPDITDNGYQSTILVSFFRPISIIYPFSCLPFFSSLSHKPSIHLLVTIKIVV